MFIRDNVNILIVYITFPDDNTPDPYDNIFWHWRPHQKPVLQGESSLLASAKADPGIPFMTRYPEYTYSDYFCEMSMGKLDVKPEYFNCILIFIRLCYFIV